MGCPKCGNKDAYESPFHGLSCNNPNCSVFDSRIATPRVVVQSPQTVVSTAVPQGLPNIIYVAIRQCSDGELAREYFPTQDEAERWIADYIIDDIESIDDLDQRREVLEYISAGRYNKAMREYNNITDNIYEVETIAAASKPHAFTADHLTTRADKYIQNYLTPEEEEEDP